MGRHGNFREYFQPKQTLRAIPPSRVKLKGEQEGEYKQEEASDLPRRRSGSESNSESRAEKDQLQGPIATD